MPISGEVYKQIGRATAAGVTVIAAYDRTSDKAVGLTASSFVTLSFNPPLVMFCIQQTADCYASMVSSQAFGVSILNDQQGEVANMWATKGSSKVDQTQFAPSTTMRVPLIAEAIVHIECLTSQIFISGDHAIVVGLVEEARTYSGQPLIYYSRQYGTFTPLG